MTTIQFAVARTSVFAVVELITNSNLIHESYLHEIFPEGQLSGRIIPQRPVMKITYAQRNPFTGELIIQRPAKLLTRKILLQFRIREEMFEEYFYITVEDPIDNLVTLRSFFLRYEESDDIYTSDNDDLRN